MKDPLLLFLSTEIKFNQYYRTELLSSIEDKTGLYLFEIKEKQCYFAKMNGYQLSRPQNLIQGLYVDFEQKDGNQIGILKTPIICDILFFALVEIMAMQFGVYALAAYLFPIFSLSYKWMFLSRLKRRLVHQEGHRSQRVGIKKNGNFS